MLRLDAFTGSEPPRMSHPPPPLTRILARYAREATFQALPEAVRQEAVRAFLNWTGCALGGCREPAVAAAIAAARLTGGGSTATILGHAMRSDLATAAFVNCLSSAILAFDDTHLPTVTHPTGPVAAALLAYCETVPVTGEAFLNALSLGMEIECRLSNALLLPPARSNVALYVTGLSGPIGAAAALGRLMRLDDAGMCWAIGHAASMAAGFRATHGAMSGLMVPAHAARNAVHAAALAASGFDGMADVLESERGFLRLFSPAADPGCALAGLGETFEVLANAYKPYPCGIVIHGALDACLEAAGEAAAGAAPQAIRLKVHPLALSLADRRQPRTFFEAQISLQHWAAYACLRRAAGVAGLGQDAIEAPDLAALRERVEITTDPSFARDEAVAELVLPSGEVRRAHVATARGSAARPMTDAELDAKFRGQARRVLPDAQVDALLERLRGLAACNDVFPWLAAALERAA
jgi:2-methylcitrate dehydratase PrpD